MNNNLRHETVLVLNRCWQAINVKSPIEAVSMMYDDSATAMDIRGDDYMVPLKWNDWVNLPYDDEALYINTINFQVKIPKVIVLAKFDRVPKKRPKFTSKNIWIRDNGICQYSGKKLSPNEANIDHVIPKSKGGVTSWTNCVLAHKDINSKKADRTLEESGLKLIRKPFAPKELPVTFYIRNKHNIKEWNVFLKDFVRDE
jgi:5-methylcytosine-specific restriction endonuclease McrA